MPLQVRHDKIQLSSQLAGVASAFVILDPYMRREIFVMLKLQCTVLMTNSELNDKILHQSGKNT